MSDIRVCLEKVGAGLVVVSGGPGVGKTAIARELASDLGWPFLSKDTIKETLADHLGLGDDEWSQRIGGASFEVVFALLESMPHAVVETVWRPRHRERFRQLDRPTVEVFCVCEPSLQRQRLHDRIGTSRHPIHREVIDPGFVDRFVAPASVTSAPHPKPEPLMADGPLLTVDTTTWPDVSAIGLDVRKALETAAGAVTA